MKTLLIIVMLLMLAVVLIIPLLAMWISSLNVDPEKDYDTDSWIHRKLLYLGTAIMLVPIRVRIHVTGKEKVPKTKKVMFVYNHVSNFDPLLLYMIFKPWNLAFLSKKENFDIPVFGRIAKRCCYLAIDREDPREALKTINQAADLLKKGEVAICASPEGTRSKTGELLPFHDGVFKVAKKADVPVVVVRIRDTEKIRKQAPLRPSDVYYDIVDVIKPGDPEWKNVHMISERARTSILEK